MQVRKISAAVLRIVVLGVLASLAFATPAQAQTAAPARRAGRAGLRVRDRVLGSRRDAAEYEIERTPLTGSAPSGPALTVGRWLPTRYSAQGRAGGERTFADSGFVLGQRYRWRVRAVIARRCRASGRRPSTARPRR